MKTLPTAKVFLLCLILFLDQKFALAQSANNLYSDLVVASDKNDTQEIDRVIKEGETLWNTNPIPYLNFELATAMKFENSYPMASLAVFNNVMEKRSPQDIIGASNYFLKKRIFILNYFNSGLISTNQSRLLQVAQFLGEARTKIIPGYIIPPKERAKIESQMGWYINGVHPTIPKLSPTIPSLETNTPEQLINATNTLQLLLIDTDNSITPLLLNFVSRVPLNNPTDSGFIQKISDAARLTDEEREKFK